MHDVPFTYKRTFPPGDTRTPAFEALWVGKTIPVFEENGVVIGESNAICVYLAETRGWKDVYPLGSGKQEAAKRAEVHSWMNWMHRNSRDFSIAMLSPVLRPDMSFPPAVQEERKATCNKVAKDLETHLSQNRFLVKGLDTPTIADLAVYADIGQLLILGLFDFKPYPSLTRWLRELEKVKGFEETHAPVVKLKGAVDRFFKNAAVKL
jgi:glutathione S-transferase